MALDLSVLDDAPRGAIAPNQIGIVVMLPLDRIEEDPGQPRRIFSLPELEQLAGSIREHGVETPIVVRPSPAGGGMHRIIHGARRYRASKLADSASIPAIVWSGLRRFDGYSQVIENLQREDLKPAEIAEFIRSRREAGERNSDIARRLGVRPEFVTWHLALFGAATPVVNAFQAGRVTGAQQVYRLSLLHERAPERVQALLASSGDITQRMITGLAAEIDRESAGVSDDASLHCAPEMATSGIVRNTAARCRSAARASAPGAGSRRDDGSATASDSGRLDKPLLRAIHDGRGVTVQLFRRPCSRGHAFVLADDGHEHDVELAALSDLVLAEEEA